MDRDFDWYCFQYIQIGDEIIDGTAIILSSAEMGDGECDEYTVLYHGHIHIVVV